MTSSFLAGKGGVFFVFNLDEGTNFDEFKKQGGSAMEKKRSFAEWLRIVKEAGGLEAYGKIGEKRGFQRGVMIMIPICIAGCGVTYKKGTQIVGFVKDKFDAITKKDAMYVEKGLAEKEKMVFVECPLCGRKAYGIDEINVIFGFIKNQRGKLEPNRCCKQCNKI